MEVVVMRGGLLLGHSVRKRSGGSSKLLICARLSQVKDGDDRVLEGSVVRRPRDLGLRKRKFDELVQKGPRDGVGPVLVGEQKRSCRAER